MRPALINAAVGLAGAAVAVAVIWLAGPLFPLLEAAPIRLVLCTAVLLAWAGGTAFLFLRRRRQAGALEAGLLAGADDGDALRERFGAAIRALRAAGSLHRQPWYVIIGPPGAGKTTALLNAGLAFPAEAANGAGLRGVGGTRDCEWWFTETAVLIDTAGRYTTQDSDARADWAGWRAFLDLLVRTRPRRPLNGIVVAIPVAEMAGAPAALRTAHARAIRQRVAELDTRLKVDLPVYLLFTKADLVAGFTEFFDDLDEAGRAEVLGTTFPLGRRRPWPMPDTEEALARLVARLDGRLLARLQQERSPERRRAIAGFPAQMASLAEPLAGFVVETFGGSKLQPAPLLRGIYFVSGTQEGTPVDRLAGVLARAFGVGGARLAALRPERGRSYFLHRLLAGVLPGEAMLVASQPDAVRRRLLVRGGAFAAVVVATLAAGAAVWTLRGRGVEAQGLLQTALAGQEQEAGRRSLDPVADSDLIGLLPLLDRAESLPFRTATAAPDLPLAQTAALGAVSRAAYRHALQRDLLPRLLVRLEAQIAGGLDRPEFCYEATRVYLMLGGAGPLDAGLIEEWMRLDWQTAFPGAAHAAGRERLAGHLDALLAEPLPAVALDGGLVERARTAFGRTSPAARVYARIRNGHRADALQPWVPRAAMGPVGAAVFVRQSGRGLEDGVPGFLTATGYATVFLPSLVPAIRAIAAESWVTGEPAAAFENAGRAATIESDAAGLYAAEFVGTWDELLGDLQIAPMRSVSQAAQDLYVLISPASPVRELLGAISRQVTLSPPLIAGRAPVPAVSPGPAAAGVAEHFRALRELVGSGPGAPLDQALRSLTDSQQMLAKMAAAAITPSVTPPGATDPVATLRADAARWPPPLRRWLGSIADSVVKLRGQGVN